MIKMSRPYLLAVILGLAGYIAVKETLLVSQAPRGWTPARDTREAQDVLQVPVGADRQASASVALTVDDVFHPDRRWGRHFPATDAKVMILILSGSREGDEAQRASVFDTWATPDTFVVTGGPVTTKNVIRLPPEAEEGGYTMLPRKVLT